MDFRKSEIHSRKVKITTNVKLVNVPSGNLNFVSLNQSQHVLLRILRKYLSFLTSMTEILFVACDLLIEI